MASPKRACGSILRYVVVVVIVVFVYYTDLYIVQDGAGPSTYGYTSFGKGAKMCLGWRLALLEIKLMAALFATEVRMDIDDERMEKAQSAFDFYQIFARFYPKTDE